MQLSVEQYLNDNLNTEDFYFWYDKSKTDEQYILTLSTM